MATREYQPWYFGNTTVRSAFRLRDGLRCLNSSSLIGNLRGAEQEKAFNNLLSEAEIVSLGNDPTYSIGRKWRAALIQHGFLYPLLKKNSGINQNEIGLPDTITPNGYRLINAESVSGMQECFLRSLVATYIPNILEPGQFKFTKQFSPLKHILRIMLQLEKLTNSNKLNFIEQALIVQFSYEQNKSNDIANKILEFRENLNRAEKKKVFEQDKINEAVNTYGYKYQTFKDYADVTFRYLRATGLFHASRKSISFAEEKHLFIKQLAEDTYIPQSDTEYLLNLCNGASLPTDNKENAELVLNDLVSQLKTKGENFNIPNKNYKDVKDINLLRYQVEDRIAILNEIDFAKEQPKKWEEIASYMELLFTNVSSKTLSNGEEIEIPKEEKPAYFEWIIWRAFLAINKLVIPAHDCRQFNIDRDFFPISTAAGGRPDLIFEFEKFVLVVEVTLTKSSRQEAAEGEPVRRHVADITEKYPNKKVYGLFLANLIDSNTAETFRLGTWYLKNDKKLILDIIPVQLDIFKELFVSMFKAKKVDNQHIENVLSECRSLNQQEAPAWKLLISKTVNDYARNLYSQ